MTGLGIVDQEILGSKTILLIAHGASTEAFNKVIQTLKSEEVYTSPSGCSTPLSIIFQAARYQHTALVNAGLAQAQDCWTDVDKALGLPFEETGEDWSLEQARAFRGDSHVVIRYYTHIHLLAANRISSLTAEDAIRMVTTDENRTVFESLAQTVAVMNQFAGKLTTVVQAIKGED